MATLFTSRYALMRCLVHGSLTLPRKLPENTLITSIVHHHHRLSTSSSSLSCALRHQISSLKRHLVLCSELHSNLSPTYRLHPCCSRSLEATTSRCFHSDGAKVSKSDNADTNDESSVKSTKSSQTTPNPDQNEDAPEIPPAKLTMFQRFHQMYKNYWYILVPVHLLTSTVWFGSFFYISKSGVDVAGFLANIGVSETITEKLRNSSAGHIAVAYALYKVATPARYTVTLGGTAYSIKWLRAHGYMNPTLDKEKIRVELREKVDELRERRRIWREEFQKRRKKGWPRKH